VKRPIESNVYTKWYKKLTDTRAKARVLIRVKRLCAGNPGDIEPIGEGCSEMKIHYGPGYRVYFKDTGKNIILLLCGGDKSTQQEDIKLAKKIARNFKGE